MSTLEEFRRRKLVQWALAYLAGAFAALQLLDILAEHFTWPGVITRGAIILLGFGFFVALVLAWYHGEKGRQRVSGPELLMVAGILAVAGAAITLVGGNLDSARPDGPTDTRMPGYGEAISERSVAVLPLDNHSPDPGDAYFAPAMTEALTNALQKIPELHVSARNSARQFTGSGMTVREFAIGELGVAHAIEGSVQVQGDRAHVTVQLIDAETGGHLWSETYEEALADVVDVQVRIARAVAEQLAATFSDRAEEEIRAGSTEDPEALDLYIQAIDLNAQTPGNLDRRIELLREAVARDPEFSLANRQLGSAFYWKRMATRDERLTDSVAVYVQRAIDTADHPSVEARYRILRNTYFGDEIGAVLRLLRQSFRTNPGDPWINWSLGIWHFEDGDLSEAVRWYRRTISLDPLEPGYRWRLGLIYMDLGLDSLARQAIEEGRALAGEPGSDLWTGFVFHLIRNELGAAMSNADSLRDLGDPHSITARGAVHLRSGDLETSRSVLEEADDGLLASRVWWEAPLVAHVMLLTGDTARADQLLRQAEDVPAAPLDHTGIEMEMKIAAVRGDVGAATEALRRLTERGGRRARRYREDPIYSRVRGDPGFEAALIEMEKLVARERREVERMLADESGAGARR